MLDQINEKLSKISNFTTSSSYTLLLRDIEKTLLEKGIVVEVAIPETKDNSIQFGYGRVNCKPFSNSVGHDHFKCTNEKPQFGFYWSSWINPLLRNTNIGDPKIFVEIWVPKILDLIIERLNSDGNC